MDINPSNLGKPLYDEDQVITYKDLQKFIDELDLLFEDELLTPEEEDRFHSVIETLIALQGWLTFEKKSKIVWNDEYWEEEEEQEYED
jgi:hypothetical protein